MTAPKPVLDTSTLPVTTPTAINVVGMPWCVQVVLGDAVLKDGEAAERLAQVVSLSWPLAKVLVKLLSQNIAAYEASEGTIPLPKSYLEVVARAEANAPR